MTQTTLLGKVELHRGQSYKSALLDRPGPHLLGLGTIARNGGFSGGSLRTYGGDSPERILVRPGDLYLSLKDVTHKAELLGAVARVPASVPLGRLTQDTVRLQITSDQLDADYLYWLLQNPAYREYCRLRGTGTTNLDLSRADFLGFEFRLPSLSEQQAIAEVLGALDNKIAANTVLAANTASVARAELHVATLDDALELRIEDATTLIARGITPRYVDDGDGVRVLNQKCVRNQSVSLQPSRWTDHAKVKPERLLSFGDVLVNSTGQGTLGRVARWTMPGIATTDSHITIVRPDADLSDPVVIGQAILAIETDIEALGQGSTGQTELSRIELGRARIRIPSSERAVSLGVKIRALSAAQDAARAENLTLAETRDALLPQLMSGKLHVRDAEVAASEAGA